MKRLILIPTLALFLLIGCSEPEPEPPPPPATTEAPKKTAEQLYQETMKILTPALRPAAPNGMAIRAVITESKNKFRPPVEPNGLEAVSKLKTDLNKRFDAATKAEQWQLVIAVAAGLEVFAKGPPERTGELKKIDRLRKRAMAELSKPRVAVKAFVDDYVGLSIMVPPSNDPVTEYVREGDSFIDDPDSPGDKILRLDEIIGDNRGVRIYYYKTDTSWIVPGPRG